MLSALFLRETREPEPYLKPNLDLGLVQSQLVGQLLPSLLRQVPITSSLWLTPSGTHLFSRNSSLSLSSWSAVNAVRGRFSSSELLSLFRGFRVLCPVKFQNVFIASEIFVLPFKSVARTMAITGDNRLLKYSGGGRTWRRPVGVSRTEDPGGEDGPVVDGWQGQRGECGRDDGAGVQGAELVSQEGGKGGWVPGQGGVGGTGRRGRRGENGVYSKFQLGVHFWQFG